MGLVDGSVGGPYDIGAVGSRQINLGVPVAPREEREAVVAGRPDGREVVGVPADDDLLVLAVGANDRDVAVIGLTEGIRDEQIVGERIARGRYQR